LSADGFPPVALAAFFGHPNVVRLLLDRGADPNQQAQNAMQVRAIHAAVARRSAEIVRMLLDAGADPNARQQGGYTPMDAAVQNGDQEIIALLVKHGAKQAEAGGAGHASAPPTA
jgi:ankyrin repeat protein